MKSFKESVEQRNREDIKSAITSNCEQLVGVSLASVVSLFFLFIKFSIRESTRILLSLIEGF